MKIPAYLFAIHPTMMHLPFTTLIVRFHFSLMLASLGMASAIAQEDLRYYQFDGVEHFDAYPTPRSDGGVMIFSSNTSGFQALAIDALNDILWCKTYNSTEVTSGSHVMDRGVFPNGDQYIVLSIAEFQLPFNLDLIMFRIGSSGEMIWSKRFLIADSSLQDIDRVLIHPLASGDFVMRLELRRHVALCYLQADGAITWSKVYGLNDWETLFSRIRAAHVDEDGILMVRSLGPGSPDGIMLFHTDLLGVINWTRTLHFGYGPQINATARSSDGSYILAGGTSEGGYLRPTLIKISSMGEPNWRMNYFNDSILLGTFQQIKELPSGDLLLNTMRSGFHMHNIRVSANGQPISDLTNRVSHTKIFGRLVSADEEYLKVAGMILYISSWQESERRIGCFTIPMNTLPECAIGSMLIMGDLMDWEVMDEPNIISAPLQITSTEILTSSEDVMVQSGHVCTWATDVAETISANDRLILSPNPTQGVFSLTIGRELRFPGQLNIYDLAGRMVNQEIYAPGEHTIRIDLTQHPPGLYVIELQDGFYKHTGILALE